ncbi:ABC transporter substrate-binding protein [Methylocaldum sp.]|uniref:ABC transporter substrate-binding protein n=1 Tax=Methylocaldum sp. TaxID=1969727 RepID=UPI002D63D99C|nr:ABC transporter substrate-binding protein [Methylocaldum sp.]HYE34928.1 ABC transporter substrate-binding protein [Methylocaldum sp.]
MALLARLSVLFWAVFVEGCYWPGESTLRVATNVWSGYEMLYAARELGLYDEGRIRLVEMTSATEVSLALQNGLVEAGTLTLDEVLGLKAKGADLHVVLVFDYSAGADVLLARPGIRTIDELKHRRVGVENTAVGAVLLDAALSSVKLDPKDIEIIHLTVDEHESAYRNGSVDALVTFEPTKSRLFELGAKPLFDSTKIPGRILDVLAVRAEALQEHRQSLRSLVDSYFQAMAEWRTHPEQTAALIAPRMALSPAAVLKTYQEIHLTGLEENRKLLSSSRPILDSTARELANFMVSRRLLPSHVSFNQIANDQWLPRLGP